MDEAGFGAIFNGLSVAVIVCSRTDDLPVVFMNAAAKLVFAPGASVSDMRGEAGSARFADVVAFRSAGEYEAFNHELTHSGTVERFDTMVLSYQGDTLSSRLHANTGAVDGVEYAFIYVDHLAEPVGAECADAFLAKILNASCHITNIDDALQTIIGLTGEFADVSRVYIFEDISAETTRNTYEWCAKDVLPAIQDLQNLNKKDYNYDAIMNSAGMVITDDTGKLPEADRAILQAQGIRAIAILPLFHLNQPLGYIGFDDCRKNRHWSLADIQLLKNVASVVSSLINRRNAERKAARSLEIVQTVTDNLDDLVYISDLDTYELKFISKSLSRAVGKSPDELLGKPCWQVLHRNQNGPCPFCPIPRLKERAAAGENGSYVWELNNSASGKWYMVKDGIVRWIDGKDVHLGTFVDITYRKQYEEQLKRFAATDAMTDVYNRKWGAGKLEELFRLPRDEKAKLTLCFIDIDGLKTVNDTLGHAMGDELIVNAIRTIFSCVRKDDFISRWGGDEFVLLLHCGLRDAKKVMDKIAFGIEHFNSTRNKPYRLSISYGLVDFSAPYERLEDLIDEADRLMYDNKVRKRDRERDGGALVPVVK